MSRIPLVVGNWKMNGSLASSDAWLREFRELCRKDAVRCESGLCVPSAYLLAFTPKLDSEPVSGEFHVGAEDVSDRVGTGAFTGEVSGDMLRDLGAWWCIVGHSERRTLYGETSERVAEKVKAAYDAGLHPILCVGETLEERNAGRTREVVLRQIAAVLSVAGIEALEAGAVAYEPLWAIGTGVAAGTDQIEPVHAVIRGALEEADPVKGGAIRILYGGSVKPQNAAEIIALPDVDGALVGGASLDAGNFYRICAAVR